MLFILYCVSKEARPNDFMQLWLDAEELSRPLLGRKNDSNADQFLSHIEGLLQSNMEVLWRNSLALIIAIVKNKEGGQT